MEEREQRQGIGEQSSGEQALSGKMLFLRYWDKRLLAAAACLLLGLSSLLAGRLLDVYARAAFANRQARAVMLDSIKPGEYSYVRLQYLTGSFAEHMEKGYHYYFGFDHLLQPYIISMEEEDITPELQALMDYTYSEEEEDTPPVEDVYGYGERIVPELMGYVRDAYSELWSDDMTLPFTMEDLSEIVGDYYLDAVPRSYLQQYPWAVGFYVVPAVILLAGMFCAVSYLRRLKAQKRRLAGREEELFQADRELAFAKEFGKGTSVYLTEHYIISASYQFEVIPYRRLDRLQMSSGLLLGITDEEFAHILAGGRKAKRYMKALEEEITGRMELARVQEAGQG
ncbi:hypothetical protein [Lacrimispora sp. 210928-DFI.3.58]|uniref:hypothetical protein n=1 Tax=Lacrimispora sp. 210928-DFI.3.58 TaxID=2883214 RepID=UPI001D083C84|nr:hypothetical protein [Lacrimispora sp. 210928-DFI.3.58]MCB7317887.1 hypothetical protein [Lacrimispora sp. 210928-DFI.3.58]